MPCMCQTEEEVLKGNYEFIMLLLCKSCKLLTKKQMISIERNKNSRNLFEVYKDHVNQDYHCESATEEEKNICLNESKRLDFTIYNSK